MISTHDFQVKGNEVIIRIATPRVLGTLLIISLFVNVAFVTFAATGAYIRSFDEVAKRNAEPFLIAQADAEANKTAAMKAQEETNLLRKIARPFDNAEDFDSRPRKSVRINGTEISVIGEIDDDLIRSVNESLQELRDFTKSVRPDPDIEERPRFPE